MGNFSSKELNDCLEALEPSVQPSYGTPVHNIPYSISVKDPRSPTEGIARTPIEIPARRVSSEALESSDLGSAFTPDLSGKKSPYRLSTIDPRLPASTFIRTPIQVANSSERYGPIETYHGLPPRKKHLETDLDNQHSYKPKKDLLLADPRSPSGYICRTPIQVGSISGGYGSAEKEYLETGMDDQHMFRSNNDLLLSDPRSPSGEIRRTPLQISGIPKPEEAELSLTDTLNVQTRPTQKGLLETDLDAYCSNESKSVRKDGNKAVMEDMSKVSCKRFCSTIDKTEYLTSGEKHVKMDKENEASLNRKLFLTPESSPVLQAGLKVRNPLGSMSNFQHSPSLLLKVKQSKKLEQNALGLVRDIEKTPNSKQYSSANGEKQIRRRQVVEWDSDSTLVI